MSVDVVLHINESVKWELALRNASHLIQTVDTPDSNIRIITNSEAVRELAPQSVGSALSMMQKLAEQGVHFVAYNNFLNSLGIRPQEPVSFVEVVPVSILELALRQWEGCVYLKL